MRHEDIAEYITAAENDADVAVMREPVVEHPGMFMAYRNGHPIMICFASRVSSILGENKSIRLLLFHAGCHLTRISWTLIEGFCLSKQDLKTY